MTCVRSDFLHIFTTKEECMQKLVSMVGDAAILLFITVIGAAAQSRPAVPKDHEEFLSGGSIPPDETNKTPRPESPRGTPPTLSPPPRAQTRGPLVRPHGPAER